MLAMSPGSVVEREISEEGRELRVSPCISVYLCSLSSVQRPSKEEGHGSMTNRLTNPLPSKLLPTRDACTGHVVC